MKIPDFTEFIPPSADIVSAAAERLVEILSESFNPSDLSKAVLILPTRSAARTLRLKINETFKKKGVFAVGGLRIVTPEIFIEEIVKFVPFANVFESYNAWFCAFDSLKARNLDGLFPRGNPQRTDYPSLAKRLTSLRKTLAESMLAIADVSRILRNGEDSKRWSDLALLEKTYLEKLSSSKKISAESAPMEAMKLASSSFPGVEEIILIGLPDPAPALIKILEQMQDRKIGIVTFSDKGDCAFFDSWGRPISEGKGEWSSRVLSVDASSILVAADLREQAGIVAEAVAIYGAEAGRAAAVACGESDSIKPLMNALRERGIDAYIPEGAPLSSLPQILLLGDLSNYILDDSYRNLTALLRNPCMFEYVSSRLNRSVGEILESIDGLFEDTIFDSSKSALALASGKKKYELAVEILKLVEDLVSDVLTTETSSRGLAILFNRFFPEIKFGEEFEDPEAISRMVADFLENCLTFLSLSYIILTMNEKQNLWQIIKFTLFSISAGIVQIASFSIFDYLFHWDYWVAYIISLVLSVIWNFTFNRRYTFKSAKNIPYAMTLVVLYYLVFTPLSTWWGFELEKLGTPDILVTAISMIINFVTEFLYQKFIVYRNAENTNDLAKPADELAFNLIMKTIKK